MSEKKVVSRKIVIILTIITIILLGYTAVLWKGHITYPIHLQAVIDEATEELEHKGLMDKVAGLVYDDQRVQLSFYGKVDPEVVEIVKAVIDRRAPGVPLEVVENVTVETQ